MLGLRIASVELTRPFLTSIAIFFQDGVGMQIIDCQLRGVSIDGTVMDLETVGLEPASNGIITVGYISNRTLQIVQAEDTNDCREVEVRIKSNIEHLSRPLYAYNKDFEERWLSDVLGANFSIDHDLMKLCQSKAQWHGMKWPRLRELVRPPIFNTNWGVANIDRQTDPCKIFANMDKVTTVGQIIERESQVDGPHVLWASHLKAWPRPEVQAELARLADPERGGHKLGVSKLPNGKWTTTEVAAIVCHNMTDLLSEASLLLWPPMFQWVGVQAEDCWR
jgi:hypothetical protein